MPVRVYGGFEDGIQRNGKIILALNPIIYRKEGEQGYRIAKRDMQGRIVVNPYPHWTAAGKWGANYFETPVEVPDEETAFRLMSPDREIFKWNSDRTFLILSDEAPPEFRHVPFAPDDLQISTP